jgi:hypothetical protein
MEMIPQSEPFDQNHEMNDHISVVAKLLKIFFRKDERGEVVGTIHCDCHLGNILKNEKEIVIVDFGTTVDRHTPFTPIEEKLFFDNWGEPLMEVYNKCCSFESLSLEDLAELLNFFMFMDAIKNKKYGTVQMKSLLTPLLPDYSVATSDSPIVPFLYETFRAELCELILDEYKREVPDRRGTIRQLQAEGRMFRAGKNKRIKHVSKRSTASRRHATRRHSSQWKKSGTLRRVQR